MNDSSNSSNSANSTEQGVLNSASNGIELEKVNNKTAEKSSNRLKITNSHKEHLKKYLKEDSLIGPTEARNRLHQETGLKVSVSSIVRALKKVKEEIKQDEIKSQSYGTVPETSSDNCNNGYKLKHSHIECLKKCLREHIYIGNTEARDLLYKKTGLKVSVSTVRMALMNLEQEINQEDVKLLSSDSMPKFGTIHYSYGYKLKYPHIECLKKYLSEESTIGNVDARNRLYQETGLEVSVTTVGNTLEKLKKEINQEDKELPLPVSTVKVRSRKKEHGFKIKDSHMECLRKYLNENSFIGPTEANRRLCEDTGLKVSVPSVWRALAELREQIDSGKTVKPSSTSGSKVESRSWSYGHKLKEVHIKCLRKYLREDISIGSTKARNRLHEETGLEVSIYPVQNALIKLRKEIYQENNELSSSTSESKVRSRSSDQGYKMKDLHIECIKKYLDENCRIGAKEAAEKLQEETGLKLSVTPIRKALIKLKGEMDPEYLKLHSSIAGIKHKGIKLKDLHIEYLKRYLIENRSIRYTEAKKRLHKETGLKVHITTVRNAVVKLKENIEKH